MHTKRTSGAMLTSVAIHFLLVLIAGLYFVTHTQTFKNIIGVDLLNTPEPPKPPQVQKPIIKPVHKPTAIIENIFVAGPVETQSRLITVAPQTHSRAQMVSEVSISNRDVKVQTLINPNVPRIVSPHCPSIRNNNGFRFTSVNIPQYFTCGESRSKFAPFGACSY